MNLRTITRGANPVTLAAARLHLKLDTFGAGGTHPDDDLVTRLCNAARNAAELFTQRRMAQDVVDLRVAAFATKLCLPLSPVASVAWLKYLDADQAEQAYTGYTFIDDLNDPHLLLTTWPSAYSRPDSVRVRFTAGYAAVPTGDPLPVPTAEVIPDDLVSAMMLMIGTWYENRGSVNVGNIVSEVPMTANHLMQPYRLGLGV